MSAVEQGSRPRGKNPLSTAARICLPSFVMVAVLSSVINVLMLSGSLYMMQVYDRVLASRSIATLVSLSLLLLLAYALQGMLDSIRMRMLSRIGARFDELIAPAIIRLMSDMRLAGNSASESVQPSRDLDKIRGFLSSLGPTALLDMPFMALFLAACFILHPWLGFLTLAGGLMLLSLTLLVEGLSRERTRRAAIVAAERASLMDACAGRAETLRALGMRERFEREFLAANERLVAVGLANSGLVGSLGSLSRILRLILQSASLGLGAYLVIRNELSPGAMIATSILTSRALAPIEVAVANWQGFVAARQGYARLKRALAILPPVQAKLPLPAPVRSLTVAGLEVALPGQKSRLFRNISFRLEAGQALAIVGHSGCGKSTLARCLTGLMKPSAGQIALDDAPLARWNEAELGSYLGYLSQDVEIFPGTVADNIARFEPHRDPDAVLAAATAAGAHGMILSMPEGYETRIGDGATPLSGGQRQRLALARALYRDPFLLVLDEPNSNLDATGDEALGRAIVEVKRRGGIVVIVTHRKAGLQHVDQVAVLAEGGIQWMGPRATFEDLKDARRAAAASLPAPRVLVPTRRTGTHA